MKVTKASRRKKIHLRIRKTVKGTLARPRLSVFRSNNFIYCQLIDDVSGHTLAAASSKDPDIVAAKGNKVEQSKAVGKLIADRAKSANISTVVFDRGGYLYHGRVKSLAEGAREGGLIF